MKASVNSERLLGEMYEESVDSCATVTFHTDSMESIIVFTSF